MILLFRAKLQKIICSYALHRVKKCETLGCFILFLYLCKLNVKTSYENEDEDEYEYENKTKYKKWHNKKMFSRR